MRQIKEVLRLHHEAHLSERQIAHGCRISRSTVQRYLERAAAANLEWPLPESLDDGQLEKLLFPPQLVKTADESHLPPKAKPDFVKIHHELKANKSVTLQLLWQEFVEQHPDAVHYSWFCEQYRAWARHLDVVLRQEHRAGEKTFVDHAGDTIPVIDGHTGQTRAAYVFVAVLGASNYTYAEATWTRALPDWIGSHTRALTFFGGATRFVVPDQWKAGVDKPCYWDPELNRTYQEWGIHNGVAIVPARPRHARDKAYVSYCTSYLLCNGEDWLPGPSASVTLENSALIERFVEATTCIVITVLLQSALSGPKVDCSSSHIVPHSHLVRSE